MPDERLPEKVLTGQMDGLRVQGRSQKQQVDDVREDLHLLVLHSYGGVNSKVGQVGGQL